MKVAGFLVVALVVASGCATTHVSSARFVSRTPAGGVVATPSAEIGMEDANSMIAAHCGGGGYAITREGESLVGNTVVTEGANSVDAQTTEGSGQVQGHENSKTVFATGSNWQVNYTCNDPRTVNMGLIARTRTTPSRFAWGADVGAGMMIVGGHAMDSNPDYQATRGGSATAMGANAWAGMKLSDKFTLGGGLGIQQVLAMQQWDYDYDGYGNVLVGDNADATAIEFFATARVAVADKLDMGVRIGVSDWSQVDVGGAAPLAALQFAYRVLDVGPSQGVYIGGGVTSYFSSDLTGNVTPGLAVGFH